MYRKILAPTDFSELATRGLEQAKWLAEATGGSIHVLYADEFLPPPHFTHTQLAMVAETIAHSRDAALIELRRHADTVIGSAVPHNEIVAVGRPADAIHDWAENLSSDLIVMATHGRGGLNRFVLGSVAERVVHEARTPVLTIREVRPEIRRILVPVNFTACAVLAFEHAERLATATGADLEAVYIAEEDASVDMVREWLCRPASRCAFTVQTFSPTTHPAEQILSYGKTTAADLIVLGAQHRRFADSTVLGTTTERIIRHSSVPVLTVICPPPAHSAW